MHTAELATLDYFKKLAAKLNDAQHGERGQLIDQACEFVSMSRDQVYRQLKKTGWRSGRKVRADRGDTRLSDDEARALATIMVESTRANGKRLLGVADAMEIASANNLLTTDISPATAMRIMRERGFHPDQIARPSPHTTLRSLHPNHVWQFDVSVCVLFYLDGGGLGVMDEKRFYKNKPENVAKISKNRVLRYLITDHFSGSLAPRYYQTSGENQETLFDFLLHVCAPSGHPQDPLHGVPFYLMWDAGSANQSFLIKNLLDRLDVIHHAHTPGNPRGKGQVENGHNIVERKFEGRLSFLKVRDIEHLNECADIWARNFNGTAIHSRHGHTRYGLWQTIRADQLRLAPPRDLCEALLRTKPEARPVRGNLVVQYTVKGYEPAQYSVAHIENVRVGEKVMVCVNPYKAPNIFVIEQNADGSEQHYECEPLGRDAAGFLVDAPIIGQQYKTPRDTDTDQHRKSMAKDAYDADTQLEVDKARKEKRPAFDGRVDPISYLQDQTPAHYMPRKGTELNVPDHAQIEEKPMSAAEAARRLVSLLGKNTGFNFYEHIKNNYPEGVSNSEFDELLQRIKHPTASLQVIK